MSKASATGAISRRAVFAVLALPPLAAPVQARFEGDIPDAGAIRVWATTVHSHAAHFFRDLPFGHPEIMTKARQVFERLVGPFPYRFRSASDGGIITVPDLDEYGRPILLNADGQRIR